MPIANLPCVKGLHKSLLLIDLPEDTPVIEYRRAPGSPKNSFSCAAVSPVLSLEKTPLAYTAVNDVVTLMRAELDSYPHNDYDAIDLGQLLNIVSCWVKEFELTHVNMSRDHFTVNNVEYWLVNSASCCTNPDWCDTGAGRINFELTMYYRYKEGDQPDLSQFTVHMQEHALEHYYKAVPLNKVRGIPCKRDSKVTVEAGSEKNTLIVHYQFSVFVKDFPVAEGDFSYESANPQQPQSAKALR